MPSWYADNDGTTGLSSREYFLATVHRAENADDKFRLKEILRGLRRISRDFSMPVVFPVHPRTRKMVEERTGFL
jgi:UDP-N-acetylglucosamine 2-epimerase (non-hydrolysing)